MRTGTKAIIGVAVTGAILAVIYEYVLNPIIVKPVTEKIEEALE